MQQFFQLSVISGPIQQLLSKTAYTIPGRLVFLQFSICINIKIVAGYMYKIESLKFEMKEQTDKISKQFETISNSI